MALAGPDDLSSVATHVHSCLNGFQNACNSMAKAELHIKRKLPSGLINDELGRFSIWSGNVGAHRRGKGSLDYKLREASHIKDRVIELLQNLTSVLQEAIDIITGDRVAWEDLSDSDSETSDDGLQQPEEQPTTELAQLASNMAEINTCLMRLSMAIRNPAPHDQFKESTHIDVAHFETFDIDHVRGKFPMAKEYLIVRLGKAISRRRQYLRYREQHRKKLEQGLKQLPQHHEVTVPQSMPRTITAPSEKIDSTVASSIPTVAKESASAAALDENDYYEDTLSQTSYASSTDGVARLRPPPLLEAGLDGDPFECPLCFRFTSVQQTAAWHKHIYRDLQPYVCTNEECEIPDRTYESRHEWFHHESQVHRKYWECVEGCNQCYQSPETLRTHLWHSHSDLATEDRIEDLIRSCERHDGMATSAECPLCQLQLPSLPLLRHHLGKHHEELSLFALLSHMKEDHEESEDEEHNDSSRSVPSAADGSPLSPFLNASKNPDNPNDDDENRLETISQPSTSVSSLSTLSSTPTVLHCDSGDCKAEFDGKHRRIDLARHLRHTHGRSSTYHCDDLDCNRRFYEEDTRLKHYRKHHPYLVYTRSTSTSAPDLDDYLRGLSAFHLERSGALEVGQLEFVVDNKNTSIRNIRKAMEKQGGYHRFTSNDAWAELGRELGHSTRLTSDGVDRVKSIHSDYLQPYDEYLERNGGRPGNVLADNSIPSVNAPENEEQPSTQTVTLRVGISAVSGFHIFDFHLPNPSTIELAENEVWYLPDGSDRYFSMPVGQITSWQETRFNLVEIVGDLYEKLNARSKLVGGAATMHIRFSDAKHKDVAHEYIKAGAKKLMLDLCIVRDIQEPRNLANTPLETAEDEFNEDTPSALESWDGSFPIPVTDIVVQGLTAEPISVLVTFKKTVIRFQGTDPDVPWSITPTEIQAVEDSGDSFIFRLAPEFWVQRVDIESASLHLTTNSSVKLGQIRTCLQYYTPIVRILPQSEREEGVSRATYADSRILGPSKATTAIDRGPSNHERKERSTKESLPLPDMSATHTYQVQGEGFESSAPDPRVFSSQGTLSFHDNVLHIDLQSQFFRYSWSSLNSTPYGLVFSPGGIIEIWGINRTDTGLTGNVSIKLQDLDKELEVRLLLDQFLASKRNRSLLEQQQDTNNVMAQDEAQFQRSAAAEVIPPTSPSAESVSDNSSILIDEQGFISDAHFLLVDGLVEQANALASIVMHRQKMIIRDTRCRTRQWRILTNDASDFVTLSSTRFQFTAECIRGYPNRKLRVAIACHSEETAKTLSAYLRGHAKDGEKLPWNDILKIDDLLSLKMESDKTLQSALLTSYMENPAKLGPTTDGRKFYELSEQSGHRNTSSQDLGETLFGAPQYSKDQYPPWPENAEAKFPIQVHDDDRLISEACTLFLLSTYIRIDLWGQHQSWYVYYKDITTVSEARDMIDVRGIVYHGPRGALNIGELVRSGFLIKPNVPSWRAEILQHLQRKGVAVRAHSDKPSSSTLVPSPPENKNKERSPIGAPLFSTLGTVKLGEDHEQGGSVFFFHDQLVAEIGLSSRRYGIEYKNMFQVACSETQITFRGRLNTMGLPLPDNFDATVTVTLALPEDMGSMVLFLIERVPDRKVIVYNHDEELQDTRAIFVMWRTLRRRKEFRRQDIVRRCQQLDPPIPPNILRHMDAFKTAVQIEDPMTDTAWELLLPRLAAELPAAERAEADRVNRIDGVQNAVDGSQLLNSSDEEPEESSEEESRFARTLTGSKLEGSVLLRCVVKASIFRPHRSIIRGRTDHLGEVHLEFFPTFLQFKKDNMRWRMRYGDIRKYERQGAIVTVRGIGQNVSQMESQVGLVEDKDSVVTIETMSEQNTEAILKHLEVFESMAARERAEVLRRLEPLGSSGSKPKLESESEASIDSKLSITGTQADNPGTSIPLAEEESTLQTSDVHSKLPEDGSHKSSSGAISPANDLSPDRDLEISDREKRKLQQQERLFEEMEYNKQQKGKKGGNHGAESTHKLDESTNDERKDDEYQDEGRLPGLESDFKREKTVEKGPGIQRAQTTKPEGAGAVVRNEADGLSPNSEGFGADSDNTDRRTPLERALQRARQSGRKPGELLKRPTATKKDEELRDPNEERGGQLRKYPCVFWFFDCDYVSSDRKDWEGHSLAHFGLNSPPQSMRCPICFVSSSKQRRSSKQRWSAQLPWSQYFSHLDEMHAYILCSLPEISRPDDLLLEYLEKTGIISEAERGRMANGERLVPEGEKLRLGMRSDNVDYDYGYYDYGDDGDD